MNKKILAGMIATVLAIGLTGCGSDDKKMADIESKLANTATIEQVNKLGEKIDQVGVGLGEFQKIMSETQALMLKQPEKQEIPSKSPDEIKGVLGSIGIQGIESVVSVSDSLYEVNSGIQFAYVTKDGLYMLAGPMVDIVNKRNLTQEKIAEKTKINVSDLNMDDAIKVVKGDGKDVFYVFSDPQCPYCRMLEKDIHAGKMEQFNNATFYIFPVVVANHPDAGRMINDIWCSNEPGKAWVEYMTNDDILKKYEEKKDVAVKCDKPSPASKNEAMMAKQNVTGTPAIYNSEGKSVR